MKTNAQKNEGEEKKIASVYDFFNIFAIFIFIIIFCQFFDSLFLRFTIFF